MNEVAILNLGISVGLAADKNYKRVSFGKRNQPGVHDGPRRTHRFGNV